ncbi:MAG: NAD(+)/NADH kinase [Synergistaceae bacterium]|jgi:NAD+ kinase|nr:NAD(+)/NADH kinase [Synergistaceae bacterium]
MRIGLFFNSDLELSAKVASAILSADYGKRAVEFVYAGGETFRGELDIAISIGGDGTFLMTSKTIMGLNVPLYGINTGRLGFLACGEASSAVRDVEKILDGNYELLSRVPLKGEVVREGSVIRTVRAFNEIMIVKNFVSRPIALSARINGEKLYDFLSDGIIVSTSAGSTAYALSSGGPVIHPDVYCAAVIPICPHSLSPRPVIVPDSTSIKIKLEFSRYGAVLSGDGQDNAEMLSGDEVLVTCDREMKIGVIRLGGGSYFGVLRNKLNWS